MILHIISSYSSTPLYKSFIQEVDSLGVSQIIYNPVRDISKIGKHKVDFKTEYSEILYGSILNNHTDKLFYRLKVNKVMKDIEARVDFSKIKLIHAHTWYSDGGVAYKLALKYKIPYIVVIRNTDINLFQKYLIHERAFGRKILMNSSKIILISASYKRKILEDKSLQGILPNIEPKLIIIPNGVDHFWIRNVYPKKNTLNNPIDIIYIGRFVKGKNVMNLQKATLMLNAKGIYCRLHLVGGEGNQHKKILDNVAIHKEVFTYHGKIFDKDELSMLMRSCDIFAMPSENETFGLVYMEALLQGLPVVYTKNEGIDGFYDGTIGEGVDNMTSQEIADKLQKIIEDYGSYQFNQELFVQNHDWRKITKQYYSLYSSLMK